MNTNDHYRTSKTGISEHLGYPEVILKKFASFSSVHTTTQFTILWSITRCLRWLSCIQM